VSGEGPADAPTAQAHAPRLCLHLVCLPHKRQAGRHSPSQAHLEAAGVGEPVGATDGQGLHQMDSRDFRQLPLREPGAPLHSVPARAAGETGTTRPKPLNFLYFQNYNYRKVLLPKSSEI